jgi:hypothetical protein
VVHRAGGRLFGCIVVAVAVAVAVVVVVAAVRVGDLGGGTQGEILGCRDSGRRREGLGRGSVVLFGVVQTSLWSFVVVRFVWELGLGV